MKTIHLDFVFCIENLIGRKCRDVLPSVFHFFFILKIVVLKNNQIHFLHQGLYQQFLYFMGDFTQKYSVLIITHWNPDRPSKAEIALSTDFYRCSSIIFSEITGLTSCINSQHRQFLNRKKAVNIKIWPFLQCIRNHREQKWQRKLE